MSLKPSISRATLEPVGYKSRDDRHLVRCAPGRRRSGSGYLTLSEAIDLFSTTLLDRSIAEGGNRQIGITLGPLLRHRFDNLTSLATILSQNRVPKIAILHGQSDEIVPLRMGAALAQLDPTRIKFAVIPEADHNDIIQKALPLILQTMGLPG